MDDHIAKLSSVFQLELPASSILSTAEFTKCINWIHKNSQNGRILSSRLVAQTPAIAIFLLHSFHVCGALHLLDAVENLFRLSEWPYCISQLCSHGASETFDTLASLCISSESDGAKSTLELISNEIATVSTHKADILRSLLGRIDFESHDVSVFKSVFLRIYAPDPRSTEVLIANWKVADAADSSTHQELAQFFIDLVPTSLLISCLISASSGLRSLDYVASACLLRTLPQEELSTELFDKARSSLQSRSIPTCLPLLLAAYISSPSSYFKLVARLYIEPGLTEQLFEVLHLILPHVSDRIATEHINTINAASKTHSPLYMAFKAQITKLVVEKLSPTASAPAAPIVLSKSNSSGEHDLVIERWVAAFERTSKPPMKEIGGLKIFSPAVLVATLDLLLAKTQNRPDSDSSVKLVLQLAKEKQITGKKYEQWLEVRMAEQRRVMSSRPAPSLKMTGNRSSTLEDLNSALQTWNKNMASGGTSSIGSIVSSLVKQTTSVNPASIFDTIWLKSAEATGGDWKSKILDLDKLFSAAIVAHADVFYPHLEAVLLREFNESAPNWPLIAISVCVVLSHDRNVDVALVRRLWAPDAFLRLESKPSFQNTLSMLKTLLQAISIRFKVVAVSTNFDEETPAAEPNLDLTAASARNGALSAIIIQWTSWVSSKLATAPSDLRFVAVELSELLKHPVLAPLFTTAPRPTLSERVDLESKAERLGLTNFAELKATFDELTAQANSVGSRAAHVSYLLEVFAGISASTNPVLSRLLRTSLFTAANGLFDLEPSPQRSTSSLRRQLLTHASSLGGLENANPNSPRNGPKDLLARSSSVSSLTSSPVSSQPQDDVAMTEDAPIASSSNWLLEYMSTALDGCNVTSSNKKTAMDWWMQAVQEVDGRWWTASARHPLRSSLTSFSAFLQLFERASMLSSSHLAARLMNDCLASIPSPGRSRFASSLIAQSPISISILALHIDETKSRALLPQSIGSSSLRALAPLIEGLSTFSRLVASHDVERAASIITQLEESSALLYATFAAMALRKGDFFASELFDCLKACTSKNGISILSSLLLSPLQEYSDIGELQKGLVVLPGVLSELSLLDPIASDLVRILPVVESLLDPAHTTWISEHFYSWEERVRSHWLRALADITSKMSDARWITNIDESTRTSPNHLQDRFKSLLTRLHSDPRSKRVAK